MSRYAQLTIANSQYFSSLERLRLAQTAGPANFSCDRCKGKRPTLDRIIPCLRQGRERSNKCGWPHRTPYPTSNQFSPADAQWFMRLPEKVQRRNFTSEERLLLSSHIESVIPDAADDIFYKLSNQQNQSVPTLSSSLHSSKSSTNSGGEGFLMDLKPHMADSTLDGFRWMEDEDELDLSLDDYHAHIIPAGDSFQKSASRRPSFRRSLSLTNLPFGMPKSSTKLPHPKSIEPPPTLPMLSHQLSNYRAPPNDAFMINVSGRPVQSSTKYYQDPEARLKLRVYLASPQKFDEALEFGFPSLDDREVFPSRRPSFSRHHTDSVLHTFLNEDNISIFGSLDSPRTETSMAEINHTDKPLATFFHTSDRLNSFKPGATDSSASHFQHHPLLRTSEPYANVLAGSREMTIRMTLTRPDLRANEAQLYDTSDDPFALEHLPPVRNAQDIWDEHPKEGMVKKLWHKMSRKASVA